jgi:hypothetical protein
MITINVVGTAADAWVDTMRFGTARETLGPDASFSAVALLAQRIKELSKAGKVVTPHPYATVA